MATPSNLRKCEADQVIGCKNNNLSQKQPKKKGSNGQHIRIKAYQAQKIIA
jgi:hypothetical protein